jgi:hypothetical protein
LGYVRILTKTTLEITPDRGDGVRPASRQEMKKGFLFNRIYMLGNDLSVYEAHQGTGSVFSNAANTLGSLLYHAFMAAKEAPYALVVHFFI